MKRGRPLSTESDSLHVNRHREQARARMRQFRERLRVVNATPTAVSEWQLQQGEQIINTIGLEIDRAAPTPDQLGLRVQGVTLAQDADGAQLAHSAVPIDEHEILYADHDHHHMPSTHVTTNIKSAAEFFRRFQKPIVQSSNRDVSQAQMSHYFQSLPATNPFAASLAPSSPVQTARTLVESLPPREQSPSAQDDVHDGATGSTIDENGNEDENEVEEINGPASEPSIEGDDGDNTVETTALEHSTQKLYDQLQNGFHGCSEEQHRDKLRQHMDEPGNNHFGLGEVFNDPIFPSVLGLKDKITPERLARQQSPTAAQWEGMFCGLASEARLQRPKRICLHQEETQAIEPDVAFDIDSFLGFANSLAVARKGLWVQPAPQKRQNMNTDVHLETTVYPTGNNPEHPVQSSLAMLRDVPQFLFGRVEGAHDITVHILFPHIPVVGDKFSALTHEQLSRWTDQVFNPAVHQFYPAHYTQHLPASFRHAWASSKAHQVEGRKIETTSYQSQLAMGYHLQPQHLESLWTTMLATIHSTPGLADFREAQIIIGAKGTKLQFKNEASKPTLLDTLEGFQSYLDGVIRMEFVQLDRFYVDIGKEICAPVSHVRSQQMHGEEEAQVYSWKRCCLEQYMKWMYDDQPPSTHQAGQRYYEQNMLYEASSLTSLTPKKSKLREGGLIYSQFYGSVKEISDAAKCKPFENDGLEEMALDPQIREGARNAAGGRRREGRIVEQAYLASKHRVRDALEDSRQKSFGIREEHRVSWTLFRALQARLDLEHRPSLKITLTGCPSYAWAVKTAVYLDFLWRSADKFATGFEVVLAQCGPSTLR